MNAAVKIRWLLALICLSLFLTAIIAKQTYSPRNNLESSAKILETHLHQQEKTAQNFIDDNSEFAKLKSINTNETYAIDLIDMSRYQKLYISTYNSGVLTYWNGIRVLPNDVYKIKEGHSFLKEPNGYYEAIKKTAGDFTVLIFIPVKNSYSYQNAYLKNIFSKDLLEDDNIDIADFTDKNIYPIHTYQNQYLFSVKLKANDMNVLFASVEILLWITGLLLLCILVNSVANVVAAKGYVLSSFLLIAAFIVALRFINLYWHWPEIYQESDLFNPQYYSFGKVFPTLGDFMINVILITWLAAYVYNSRHVITVNKKSALAAYAIFTGCVFFLIGTSLVLLNLFSSLILNSTICFEVNNVLNLTGFSVIGVLLLCFGFLIFMLFSEACLTVCLKLNLSNKDKLIIFGSLITMATLFEAYQSQISGFFILWSLIILIRAYSLIHDKGKFSPLIYIAIIVICSTISSIKLYFYQSIKEQETRKLLMQKLESADDPIAEDNFRTLENQIVNTQFLSEYFNNYAGNYSVLKNRFQKLFFDGYHSKYDFKIYEYDASDQPLDGNKEYSLDYFKDRVLYQSFKVPRTRYFYKVNNNFGFQSYFAIIPIGLDTAKFGTVIIDLQSKPLTNTEPFPELLIEGNPRQADELKKYSYAFYNNGKLLNQSGKYTYSLVNHEFQGKAKQYIYKTTREKNITYSHLIYKPTEQKIIVISKESDKLYTIVTSLTFFFMVFLIFMLLVLGYDWAVKNLKKLDDTTRLRWNFWESFDKVLYKTRIQLSMVFAVVVTLLIIGIFTFISVSSQYHSQQDSLIHDKISRIAIAFEKADFDKTIIRFDDETQARFNSFADTYSSDLTLFDKNGIPLITTQPKLYDDGLIARRMNAKAFVYLNRLEKSSFINDENIGTLTYKAAYAPVKNSKSDVIGFLQLPYFSNESEYNERIGAYLNTMINVYALVFIAIGLFAIVVARQITTPLTIIQQSLSKTIYGRKNEPIEWRHNDEIGSLIKEYNNMIAALENSAQKLAQSERENAWREMAKQVAHEIKNPLTPLKLGLQLLEKSWKDKDPKFDIKFERFSKSFVEQIDSLSKIASEFSNFAKMPETRVERMNIYDIINQAATIFKQTDNLTINYTPAVTPFFILADRDQMLRGFNNLLKNAIEAVPVDRAGVIDINHEQDGKYIYVKIKDNGNGIPDALRERIFVPNFTTKSSGTGLGLAMVKNAIEHAGGTITFETTLQVGTTFYLSFPAAV